MLQQMLSRMRRAIEDYEMIQDGDKVCVGVSGGKDSLMTLIGLRELQRFLPKKFELMALTLNLGFPSFDAEGLKATYEKIGIPYVIEPTEIAHVVFDIRKETNPCSLCANLKRGAIHSTAKALGCNKVAFGHHMDDAVETLLMAQIYEGRLFSFAPVTYLDRTDMTLIRPMIYTEEKMIRSCMKEMNLTAFKSGCPADGSTKRQFVKDMLHSLKSENPHIKACMFGAIQRAGLNGWKEMSKGHK